MANTEFSLRDINDNLLSQYPAIVKLPKVAAPYTTVVNRAQVTDFSKDLLPRFGIDRFMMQAIHEVQGEYGSNGERVFKAVNDVHDAVRMVGDWFSAQDSTGQYSGNGFIAGNTTDYFEVIFYGTGLNILTRPTGSYSYTVDGGIEVTGVNISTYSGVLSSRNYNPNHVTNIVSGLTVGLHTVRIRSNNSGTSLRLSGYEVLNTSSTLQQTSGTSHTGGQRFYASTLTTSSPTSGFTNTYGTLGTRGGHVLVYQKADGTIAKDIRYTETSAAYLGSANHTNEEVVRTYHWREFGAGRSDDFSSLLSGGANKAFTLDDGTTTLVGDTVSTPTNEGLAVAGTSKFWTLTFVGTGLDLIRSDTNTIAVDQHTIYIDGTSIGTITGTGVTSQRIQKICSGLSYGTHTIKFERNAFVNAGILTHQFIVYAPKVPVLPANAVALADYFVMADFIANSTAGVDYIATGVLRKASTREFIYVNGTGGTQDWSVSFTIGENVAGIRTQTDRQNAYYEYTFFGTGFELREIAASNRSANISVQLQSISTGGSLLSLTSGNFGTAVFSTYGTGVSFSSGTLDINDASVSNGVGFRTSGLPLALYKVRFTNNTASSFMTPGALDIITPIHAPKLNGPFIVQNTLTIGSCAIRDLREFGEQQIPTQKKCSQAIGISNSQTTTVTASPGVPIADMSTIINVKSAGSYCIFASVPVQGDSANLGVQLGLMVNGQLVSNQLNRVQVANQSILLNHQFVVNLSPGFHKIDVYWWVGSGTGSIVVSQKVLTVQEI